MKKLGIIVVGVDQWEEFTAPAILSIVDWAPEAHLVIMDAASKVPYHEIQNNILTKGSRSIIRLESSPSYAYAINSGIQFLNSQKCDWFLILNNDILLKGPIFYEGLDPNTIYGRQIIVEGDHKWLGLWLAMISKETIHTIGVFDEKFLLCGFEDADYCIRAKDAGIETDHYPFPVHHFWGKTRWGLPNYSEVRQANIDYFEEKHGFRLGGPDLAVIHD